VPRISGIEVTMTDAIKRSDLKYPNLQSNEPRGALEPVIQSAVGIVRESAGLLYHIAELCIALVSGPNPKCGSKQTSVAAPKNANVIPFPQLEASSPRPKLHRNKS
jgi:hypothetical protein